ncbi:hypothetical protein Tco_0644692 [Tanacetum coccineum]
MSLVLKAQVATLMKERESEKSKRIISSGIGLHVPQYTQLIRESEPYDEPCSTHEAAQPVSNVPNQSGVFSFPHFGLTLFVEHVFDSEMSKAASDESLLRGLDMCKDDVDFKLKALE